jgi:hypothetical protein
MQRRTRTELYILAGLAIVLVTVYYAGRHHGSALTGVLADDTVFRPLDVEQPELRIDLIEEAQKAEVSGPRRNIFIATAAPIPRTPATRTDPRDRPVPPSGPQFPPPPPPLQAPAQFFGFESLRTSGKRVGFFLKDEDVIVVAEGDTFLNGFRLVHIGNDSADVEEVATGRRITIKMEQPPEDLGSNQ